MKYSGEAIAVAALAFFFIGLLIGVILEFETERYKFWELAQEEIRICEQTLPRDQICVVQLSAQPLPRGEE